MDIIKKEVEKIGDFGIFEKVFSKDIKGKKLSFVVSTPYKVLKSRGEVQKVTRQYIIIRFKYMNEKQCKSVMDYLDNESVNSCIEKKTAYEYEIKVNINDVDDMILLDNAKVY